MSWFYLLLAAVFEVTWAVAMIVIGVVGLRLLAKE